MHLYKEPNLYILLAFLLISPTIFGQLKEQDCISANSVCNTVTAHPQSYTGPGLVRNEINPGTSCLKSGEMNDVWYIITVINSGDLNFFIKPYNYQNIAGVIMCDDYDWAVFDITNANCSDIYSNPSLEVSCNYSSTQDITGTRAGELLSSQASNGSTWNKPIPVTAGQTLMLNVSNFSGSQSGYTLDFSGSTASIYDTVRPRVTSVIPQCNTSLTVKFSENVLCSTVNASSFSVAGPGGPYAVSLVNSPCATGSTYENEFQLSVTPPFVQSGSYTLSINGNITDNCGNILRPSSPAFTITNALYLGRDTALCSGQSITLNATVPSATSYLWSNGATGASITVSSGSQYFVEVNANGCTLRDTILLNFTAPGSAGVSATADQNNICAGTVVAFTAAPVNGGSNPSYQWYVNGVAKDNGAVFTSSSLSNNDRVTVTMTSNAGCVSNSPVTSAPIVMTVLPVRPVSVTVAADTNNICDAVPITLSAAPTNGGSAPAYQWYVNNIATGSNSRTYTSVFQNNDVITVKVTSNASCVSGNPATSAPMVIRVHQPPAANAGTDKVITCIDSSVQLGAMSNPALSYAWSPLSGLSDGSAAQPFVTAAGTYMLTVKDRTSGCTATDDITVTKNTTPPVANAGIDKILSCASQSVTLGTAAVPGYRYSWSPATGLNAANIAEPSTRIADTYTLTVANPVNGCIAADEVNVRENISAAFAEAGEDIVLTCNTPAITIGGAALPGFSYSWQPAAGLSNALIAQPVATQPGNYTLTVTDLANGCISTDAITILQNVNLPAADAGSDKVLNCSATRVQLGSAAVAGYRYSWAPTAGLSDPSSARPFATTPGNYVVSVTNTATGCTATDTVMVTADNAAPTANAGADVSLTCVNRSVTIGASTANGNVFSWLPTVGISNANAPQTQVTQPELYVLTVTDPSNGCISRDTVLVNSDTSKPVADGGPDRQLTCLKKNVSIGLPGNGSYAYAWSSSNGWSAHTPAAVIDAEGMYMLTVTNSRNGCFANDTVNVTKDLSPPNAEAGNDKMLTCIHPVVQIGVAALPDVTFKWTPSAGLSNANIAQPRVSTAGVYVLSVIKNSNGCVASDSVVITENKNKPFADGGTGGELTCSRRSVSIGAAAIPGNSYSWMPAAGLTGTNSAIAEAEKSGTYILTVTNNANGCSAADTVTVTENMLLPEAKAGSDKVISCDHPQVTIGSNANASYVYSWSPASGLSAPAISQPVTAKEGIYILKVINALNGCFSYDTVEVTRDMRMPKADAGANQTLTCMLKSVTAGSAPAAGYTYSWYPTKGLSNPSIAQPSVSLPGKYMLTVKNNATGCTAVDSVLINQDIQMPAAHAGPDAALTCTVKYVRIGTPEIKGNRYEWSPAAGISSAASAQTNAFAEGSYLLRVTNEKNGCTAIDSVSVSIDTVAPVADAGENRSFDCPRTPVVLGSTAIDGMEYHWSEAKGLSAVDVAQPVTDSTGIFSLYVINVLNGCKSAADTVTVYGKNCDCRFFVPTAFSPNHDGVNDVLSALKYCDDYRDFRFSVYNRWGQLVYSTKDLHDGWDGVYKDGDQQTDTFLWTIEYFDVVNQEKMLEKGIVILLK
jgi:gliding motility-associated-like protein